jgi:hypothetical protein
LFDASSEVSKSTFQLSSPNQNKDTFFFIKNSYLPPSFEVTLLEYGSNAQVNETR